MPKRKDIKSIMVVGSGPIVIGQACEFDYSGTQAIKVLKEEGYKTILVNSNPATIMTDPELADRTYIEPLCIESLTKIIEKERPDAILSTMGGQTALNLVLELADQGILNRYSCEVLGASSESIKKAEDRALFKEAMERIGLRCARSGIARDFNTAEEIAYTVGFPCVVRPSRTLGGSGGGYAKDVPELLRIASRAFAESPVHEVLIEESLLGWKEIELEVVRDNKDNVIVVCGIENIDPMGVHTGDSITVAPIQTLTDKEYQYLRDCAIKVIREIGVDTGGSNVQFAVNPLNGEVVVIEMNPRVSRSSALASKATGFPIAKVATRLAVGYSLDEVTNDITGATPACFEPSIDYVVVKIPRFNFEKFPLAEAKLGTQMKSVGEAMGVGRCFKEALQKAINSLELGKSGLTDQVSDISDDRLMGMIKIPNTGRLWAIAECFRRGKTIAEINRLSGIDPWFLEQINSIVEQERYISEESVKIMPYLAELKATGFSDAEISKILGSKMDEKRLRRFRKESGIVCTFKEVDTCAGEFSANTPYYYSTYEDGNESEAFTDTKTVVILGAGPNRIGQGIEFDYCCVHAVMAIKEFGYHPVMVNCNPETVSTDYDVSDKLYFEPITFEYVMNVVENEQPLGVIVQFGGQTPLKLAMALESYGVNIIGTSARSIFMAEDRKRFGELLDSVGISQPKHTVVDNLSGVREGIKRIGLPVLIRPSHVLGGRAMRIVETEAELDSYIEEYSTCLDMEGPILIDRYIRNAIEVDVDAVCDGEETVIAGILEHIERTGVHSGDSSCVFPPVSLSEKIQDRLCEYTDRIARSLKVKGLVNVQYAIDRTGEIYVIEANPRASRTVPFVSKATLIPWAKVATRVMLGQDLVSALGDYGVPESAFKGRQIRRAMAPRGVVAVKACVFPFNKFPGVDPALGPEMRSTGEVMGIGENFAEAVDKAIKATGCNLPSHGKVFLSLKDSDKPDILPVLFKLKECGFSFIATHGTRRFIYEHGFECEPINKVREGSPHIVEAIENGEIAMVINTPEGSAPFLDSTSIRVVSREKMVPLFTTVAGASAAVSAMYERFKNRGSQIIPLCLQELKERFRENAENSPDVGLNSVNSI